MTELAAHAPDTTRVEYLLKWLYGLFATAALMLFSSIWFPNPYAGPLYLLLGLSVALVLFHLKAAKRGERPNATLKIITTATIAVMAVTVVVATWWLW